MKNISAFLLALFAFSAVIGDEKPNFIVIFTDDQGYQDLGCFGSPQIKTPRIDRMADEGLRLTSFYVGAPVCSASRASLLTGRYISRHGIGGAFWPESDGLASDEVTIAEILKPLGYKSACYGKWHLGDQEYFLPQNQGFEEYFGIPYSNDMYIGPSQKFAGDCVFTGEYNLDKAMAEQEAVAELRAKKAPFSEYRERGLSDNVPIFEGSEIVEFPAVQETLTQRYFDRAIDFLERNRDNPFFLYIAPAMPHVPLFASQGFAGQSERGPYGDVLEEIDFHVGRLLDYLEENGLSDNTLVIYTSDNGPWLPKGDAGGSALPLRNGKHSIYEGGVRVPTVMWWPGKIRTGSESDAIVSTIDFLPTFAKYAGAELPEQVIIDGIDVSEHIENSDTPVARDSRIYHNRKTLAPYGIRVGDFKYLQTGGKQYEFGPELYNLAEDISESRNLIEAMPEKAAEMNALVEAFKASL